jgi:hypothetical protein
MDPIDFKPGCRTKHKCVTTSQYSTCLIRIVRTAIFSWGTALFLWSRAKLGSMRHQLEEEIRMQAKQKDISQVANGTRRRVDLQSLTCKSRRAANATPRRVVTCSRSPRSNLQLKKSNHCTLIYSLFSVQLWTRFWNALQKKSDKPCHVMETGYRNIRLACMVAVEKA